MKHILSLMSLLLLKMKGVMGTSIWNKVLICLVDALSQTVGKSLLLNWDWVDLKLGRSANNLTIVIKLN